MGPWDSVLVPATAVPYRYEKVIAKVRVIVGVSVSIMLELTSASEP